MLSERLRELEAEGIVHRTVIPEVPVRIEYALTDKGRALQAAMLSVLDKAGYDVRFPSDLSSLCCGLAFESKGFPRLADEKARELERALLAATEGGRLTAKWYYSARDDQRAHRRLLPGQFTTACRGSLGLDPLQSRRHLRGLVSFATMRMD